MSAVGFGFLFGIILQYARLNCFDTVVGLALGRNFTMAKTMAFAIGLGLLLMPLAIQLGWGSYHVKPLIIAGLISGGILFGLGMGLLGYCPGTIAIALGQGKLDALAGIGGGLIGALLFALAFPLISPWLGPNLGALSLRTAVPTSPLFWGLVLGLSVMLMGLALLIQRHDHGSWHWLWAAMGLPLLNIALNFPQLAGHPIGASTAFPWLAMTLTHWGSHAYWKVIQTPGAWEFLFLIGACLSGLLKSVFQRRFHWSVMPPLWQEIHGNKPRHRLMGAFIGGLLLLLGARLAGGCTSGHILSGGMQLAASSTVFALSVLPTFLIMGRWFHRTATCSH